MEKNVGGLDRAARWAIGAGLMAYGLNTKGWKRWLALTGAGCAVSTAATGKCAMNKLWGIDTSESAQSSFGSGEQTPEDAKIDEASAESFPASDAPAFTAGRS